MSEEKEMIHDETTEASVPGVEESVEAIKERLEEKTVENKTEKVQANNNIKSICNKLKIALDVVIIAFAILKIWPNLVTVLAYQGTGMLDTGTIALVIGTIALIAVLCIALILVTSALCKGIEIFLNAMDFKARKNQKKLGE